MSGKVIQTAVIPHQCDPGWTWKPGGRRWRPERRRERRKRLGLRWWQREEKP